VKRREFITLVGGAAAAWPPAARAQQARRLPLVGVLFNLPAEDQEAQARLTALVQGLQELGWADRYNIRIVTRWATNNEDQLRSAAADLVAETPDLIVANSNPAILAVRQANPDARMVFTASTDPVGAGIVESLARPGGNATGFISTEYGMSAKWLELLREVAPGVTRVAVLLEASNIGAIPQFAEIQVVAPSFRMESSRVGLGNAEQIERSIAAFAGSPNGGLIASRTSEAIAYRKLIIKLAARYRLPAVYPLRLFVNDGGLVSYGPDIVAQFRLAAGYVDRILKGEKPSNLPVQIPNKFELVVNLKTAKTLGLTLPTSLLARADEVIE
jgi:putative tryptophan/tyrosine transport system substrate-binding protein